MSLNYFSVVKFRRATFFKAATLLILSGASLSSFASGGYQNHKEEPQKGDVYAGHMIPKENMQSTVTAVSSFKQNSWITLEGSIISQQKGNHFTFRDNTGHIPLVVSDDAWRGLDVDALSLIRVSGYVKENDSQYYLDVRHIELP